MDISATNNSEVYFSAEDFAQAGFLEEMLVAMGFSQNESGTCSTMASHSNVSVSVPPMVSLSNQEMQKYSQEFLVEIPENPSPVPLNDETIKDTIDVMVGDMIGSAKYLKMERADSGLSEVLLSSLLKRLRDLQNKGKADIEDTLPLLDELLKKRKDIEQKLQEIGETSVLLEEQKENKRKLNKKLDNIYLPLSLKLKKTSNDFLLGLLSRLPESLKDLKEQNEFVVTLEEVKNEASRWIYFHKRVQSKKVAAHPQHINNIPGVWRNEHPGCKPNCNPLCKTCERTCYPPERAYQSIASYTGLEICQVQYLFDNDRKRRALKDPTVGNFQLKKRFDKDATDKLRIWKANNPGKELDKASLKELMDATGMNIKQIRNWFHNNARGRENRNL